MKSSSPKSVEPKPTPPLSELARTANAAMRRAARQVAAENKRLGIPLVAEKPVSGRSPR